MTFYRDHSVSLSQTMPLAADRMTIAVAPPEWTATLVYADTPPSLNRTGTRGHWRSTHGHKRRWQTLLEALLMESRLPRDLTTAEASASLRFRVRRERDEGNYRWLLEKALGDALVNGGWLVADSANRFRFGAVTFEALTGPARTTLTVTGRRAA